MAWLSGSRTRPRPSPYSSPGVIGWPPESTAVSDGTIADTATARASGRASWSSAASGPCRQASSALCSSRSGAGTRNSCGYPCPRDHPAILVGGDRFDGGGADVDADCDLFA